MKREPNAAKRMPRACTSAGPPVANVVTRASTRFAKAALRGLSSPITAVPCRRQPGQERRERFDEPRKLGVAGDVIVFDVGDDAIAGESRRKDPSLSSLSVMNQVTRTAARVRGRIDALAADGDGRIEPRRLEDRRDHRVVVVLPCVPAIAIVGVAADDPGEHLAAQHDRDAAPHALRSYSGLSWRIALDTTTTSAAPTLRRMMADRDRRRLRAASWSSSAVRPFVGAGDARRRAASSSRAIALIPIPPMPTKW